MYQVSKFNPILINIIVVNLLIFQCHFLSFIRIVINISSILCHSHKGVFLSFVNKNICKENCKKYKCKNLDYRKFGEFCDEQFSIFLL